MNRRRILVVLSIMLVMFAGLAMSACAENAGAGENSPSEKKAADMTPKEREAKNGEAAEYFQKLMESFGSIDGSDPDTYPDWYGGAYIDEADEVLTVYVYGDEDVSAKLEETMGMKNFRTKEAQYPYNELNRVMDVINEFVIGNPENPVAKNSPGDYLSDKDNRVIVGLLDMSQEQQDLFKKEVCDSPCIVFEKSEGSAVEEVSHYPADAQEIENDGIVEARAELSGDELSLVFENKGDKPAEFGTMYDLQAYEGSSWSDPLPSLIDHEMVALGMSAGGTYEDSFSLTTVYGELPAGRYRISKKMDLEDEDGKYTTFVWARAEFDIP